MRAFLSGGKDLTAAGGTASQLVSTPNKIIISPRRREPSFKCVSCAKLRLLTGHFAVGLPLCLTIKTYSSFPSG